MRLVQATGVLSDFLLFGPGRVPAGTDIADVPIINKTRAELMERLNTSPPRVLVISSSLHLDGPDDYAKLERWPAFERVLDQKYVLSTEWNRRGRCTGGADMFGQVDTAPYLLRSVASPR